MNSLLFKILYPFVWLFMKIFYPFEIIGEEKLAKQDKIIIYANHISFLDPINLIILAHRNKKVLNFMAKDELFKNALFSWFLKKMGAFSVKRGDGAASLKKAARHSRRGKDILHFSRRYPFQKRSARPSKIGNFLPYVRNGSARSAGSYCDQGAENEGLSKDQNRGMRPDYSRRSNHRNERPSGAQRPFGKAF